MTTRATERPARSLGFVIRMNRKERDELHEAARARGLDASAYLRELVNRDLRKREEAPLNP